MTGLLERARTLLGDQRGGYLAQQMVGAMVSFLVMAAITTAMVSATTIFKVIAERTAVTQQATSTGAALRSDTTWASAIVPGDEAGQNPDTHINFVIPGRDARCQESTWVIRPAGEGRHELVNQVANYDAYDTSTTPVTCTGARDVLTEQVMVRDIDPRATFRYYNAGGRMFDDPLAGTFAPECAPGAEEDGCQADPPTGAKARDLASKSVVSVELATTVGKSSKMAMPYVFRETATNLHKAPSRPADDSGQVGSFFQDHIVLGG